MANPFKIRSVTVEPYEGEFVVRISWWNKDLEACYVPIHELVYSRDTRYKDFNIFSKDPDLFRNFKLVNNGAAIVWGDGIVCLSAATAHSISYW